MPATKTPRTRVRRAPARGVYDRQAIDAILDEGLIAHLGFVHDGHPFVIPTLYARIGDNVYVHGSGASRTIRTLTAGLPAALTVTLVDGVVLARSAFHHSVNYRSVVVLGHATPVEGPDERLRPLEALTERLVPGRWDEVRPPSPKELKATRVLSMGLDECSAKVRTGPPVDDEGDYELPVWAGVIPMQTVAEPPIADPLARAELAPSDAVTTWTPQRRRQMPPS